MIAVQNSRFEIRRGQAQQRQANPGMLLLCCCCLNFTISCIVVIALFSALLGTGISQSTDGTHLVEASPSYTEATQQTGHFDDDGVYQGGRPHWNDWSEDSFSCRKASDNGEYCQSWTTERYHKDPEEQFLKGNCSCIKPGFDNTSTTTLSSPLITLYSTSSTEAALVEAKFCYEWECYETKFTKSCTCDSYTTTCNRRRLASSGSKSGTTCSDTCNSWTCEYLETSFETLCDCDYYGTSRFNYGPAWWNASSYCDAWRCTQREGEQIYISVVEGDGNATSFASSAVTANESIPDDVSESYWLSYSSYEMEYACSEAHSSGLWCRDWRGKTDPYVDRDDYVEQLCECSVASTWSVDGNASRFCAVCSAVGGILLGGLILLCTTPYIAGGLRGYCPLCIAVPFGIAAAFVLAVFVGGVPAILEGGVPISIIVLVMSVMIAKFIVKPTNSVHHGEMDPASSVSQAGAISPHSGAEAYKIVQPGGAPQTQQQQQQYYYGQAMQQPTQQWGQQQQQQQQHGEQMIQMNYTGESGPAGQMMPYGSAVPVGYGYVPNSSNYPPQGQQHVRVQYSTSGAPNSASISNSSGFYNGNTNGSSNVYEEAGPAGRYPGSTYSISSGGPGGGGYVGTGPPFNQHGPSNPHDGPGVGQHHGPPGGPNNHGPGGPNNHGPSGPNNHGPGGPNHHGPGGPHHHGPSGPYHHGPGGPHHHGPGGPYHHGPGGPHHGQFGHC